MSNQFGARVFISCGQRKETDETNVASDVAKELKALGFDPYVATEEQTLKGLRENIFRQLELSEYFVFIDFRREVIRTAPQVNRGSLFSHQELAVASFLELPVIALQEEGVDPLDGLMRFLQANSIPFKNRGDVPQIVVRQLRALKWDPNWKNQLVLEQPTPVMRDATRTDQIVGRFFHVRVHNLNPRRIAINAYSYLESFEDIVNGRHESCRTAELKWEGYVMPNAAILPSSFRSFDAFWIAHQNPREVRFNLFSDSSYFFPRISGPGKYSLTYAVVSENFPPTRRNFILHLDATLEGISFTPA